MSEDRDDITTLVGDDRKRPGLFRITQWMIDKRVPVAIVRAIFGAVAIVIGALLISSTALQDVLYILGYIILFLLSEYLFVETSRDTRARIERDIRQQYDAQLTTDRQRLNAIAAQLELYWGAQQKISFRIGKTAETIAAIVKLTLNHPSGLSPVVLKKEAIIDEVLGDLCDALESTTSKSRGILRPDSWFRATYMEVREIDGAERLAFIAFHTPDGVMPTSMSRNLTMARGEGDAGNAWQTRRPVVEDLFKNGHGWKELYTGQGQKYKSMICVPVFRGTRDMANDVIGVITIDTRVRGFFGAKDNQEDEDRFAGIVRPYASYICLISALNDALTLPTLHAVPSVQSRVTRSTPLERIEHSHSSSSEPSTPEKN